MRTITTMDWSVSPIVVHAGFPSPAEPWREPTLDIQQLLGLAAEQHFCLRMPSLALAAAGIARHDLLVASPTLAAAHNDIVLASVNEWRGIRRLVIAAGVTMLVPENPGDPTHPRLIVLPGDDFALQATMVCSIHPLTATARHQVRQAGSQTDLNRFLGLDQPDIFATRVRGTSMRAAGIYHGDVVIVSRSETARENDIIIASYDGAMYIKRLVQVRGAVFLLSDNPLTPPIVVTADNQFQTWGVALFSLHPLHPLLKNKLLEPGPTTP